MTYLAEHFAIISTFLSQLIVFVIWLSRLDSRVSFLAKRTKELDDKFKKEVSSIEAQLSKIYTKVNEMSTNLAVVIDRQKRNP